MWGHPTPRQEGFAPCTPRAGTPGRYNRPPLNSKFLPLFFLLGGGASPNGTIAERKARAGELSTIPGADADEVAPGVVMDCDAHGQIVGIDVEDASKRVDLSRVESEGLPVGPITGRG